MLVRDDVAIVEQPRSFFVTFGSTLSLLDVLVHCSRRTYTQPEQQDHRGVVFICVVSVLL